MVLIYVLMLACAAGLAAFIYRYDLHEKEPWYMVAFAVGMGFAAMWVAGIVEGYVLAKLAVRHEQFAARAVVVAHVESLGRVAMVLAAARLFRSRFADPLDGLMYGTLGGLGMAIEESLLYLSLAPANAHTLGVEVVRLFAHSLMGGLVGFAVGQWVRPMSRPHPKPILTTGCLACAVLVHFSWDFIAYQNSHTALLKLLPMLLMLALMLVWGGLVAYASEQSRDKPPRGTAGPRAASEVIDEDETPATDLPL
jgi:RsiW-degrading membrane proteinase PrsW (M82 family)